MANHSRGSSQGFAEHKEVVEPQLEAAPALQDETVPAKERPGGVGVKAMVLFEGHPIRQTQPAQQGHAEVCPGGRDGNNHAPAGAGHSVTLTCQRLLIRYVFQRGQHHHRVEGSVGEGHRLAKRLCHEPVAPTAAGHGQRVQAHARTDPVSQLVQELALVTADVQDFRAEGNPRPGHAGPPALQETIQNTHECCRLLPLAG
jgi:hypothetical protein